MKAILLLGGFGTRLQPLTNALPKGVLPLGNKNMGERIIDICVDAGITDIIVNCNSNRLEMFKEAFSHIESAKLTFVGQPVQPVGLPGAIHFSEDLIHAGEKFIVMCDVLVENSLRTIISQFETVPTQEYGIITFPLEDTAGYGYLEIGENDVINAYPPKDKNRHIPGQIESGYYLFDSSVFKYTKEMLDEWYSSNKEVSIWSLFSNIIAAKHTVKAYELKGWWADIGGSHKIYQDAFKRYSNE